VSLQLSHREARSLFPALIDAELDTSQELGLRSHLDGCDECRGGWSRYERAVEMVRGIERKKAPPALATQILRRVQRKKPRGLRAIANVHSQYRVPYEIIIPILLAALAAAWIVALAP
jgi:predicted anti-sigma-YlaC factor YlaD